VGRDLLVEQDDDVASRDLVRFGDAAWSRSSSKFSATGSVSNAAAQ
jgi:hypothetical protein